MKGKPILTLLIILVPMVATLAGWISKDLPGVKMTDFHILDAIMQFKGGIAASDNIILVNIDQTSINEIGQAHSPEWRKYHPQTLNNLKPAKVIAIDLVFDGPTQHDPELAYALNAVRKLVIGMREDYKIPQRILASSKPGYVDLQQDPDYKVRRMKPARQIKADSKMEKGVKIGQLYYQLSFRFRIITEYFNIKQYTEKDFGKKVIGVRENNEIIEIGDARRVPRDNEDMMYIRNLKAGDVFEEFSYSEVHEGNSRITEKIKGSIVILGKKASPEDVHETPYGEKTGMELHALAVNTVLKEAYIRHAAGYLFPAFLFIASLLLAVSVVEYGALAAITVGLTAIASTLISTYFCYWVQTTPFIVTLAVTPIILMVIKRKKNLDFAIYTKPELQCNIFAASLFLLLFFIIAVIDDGRPYIPGLLVSLAASAIIYIFKTLTPCLRK
ncbi:MAG: CHASE2 domain-containing protein [Desulfobacteraceae bacterium]|nr:CHASE2 domain-containing protein [Desulfobacteraceae bacterium]